MNDTTRIRRAINVNKSDMLRSMRLDYSRNENDSFRTSSETAYNAMMARLRHLRIAIAHIEANDFDAFKDCQVGVFVVADYHAEIICPDT